MPRTVHLGICLILVGLFSLSYSATPSQWKNRAIYQVLTDRFAKTTDTTSGCSNLGNYCGGTFKGLINHLDYIASMGFDAIWISPVVTNTDGGYHGYWAKDFYGINSYFGSSTDLKNLVSTAHSKGIYVMIDVVANHVGPVGYSYSSINPFKSSSDYHDCNGCPSSCNIEDWNNQNQIEHCRLSGLPDLNQDSSSVKTTLNNWVRDLVGNYSFDGIRVDTVPEVSKSFWTSFQDTAGVFGIGEVFNGDPTYCGGYQGPLDSVLNYPMYFTLRDVFASKQSMNNIQTRIQQNTAAFSDLSVLGTFVDNHDNSRFLYSQSDQTLYKNALTYVLLSQGIPIVYYGSEQAFRGGNDPNNREVLWPTSYSTSSSLYKHIQTVNAHRKKAQVWNYSQVQRYSTTDFYAFTRGNTFVALTNKGSSGAQVHYTITYHPYTDGTKLCNIFYTTDCVYVQNGKFDVYLNNGECKVFYPA